MTKKLLYLTITVSALGLASNASAALVARWTFNNSPNDQVGTLNWTLNGGATYSTDRKEGSHSLQCDGKDDYAGLAGSGLMSAAFTTKTVMLWFKPNTTTGTQVLYDEGGSTQGMAIRINNGMLEAAVRANSVMATVSTPLSNTNWSHVAISFNSGAFKLYLNGVEVGSTTATFASVPSHTNASGLGARNAQDAFGNSASGDYYGGLIDDVQMYDSALTQAEIAEAMSGWPKARQPSPANGAQNVGVPLFQWTAGSGAQWHDLYLGTSPDLGPKDLVGPRLMVPMYWHVAPLTPGTTYYWRVDAVSDDGATVVQGDIWTFIYASLEAWSPVPADGAKYIDPNLTLTWQNGLNGVTHDVYFGTDKGAVNGGAASAFQGNQVLVSFRTGDLQLNTCYYWRVDEVDSKGEKVKGKVWSFSVIPNIPITDPNLVAWWDFNEGLGSKVVDWSGHGNHGLFEGNPTWVPGYDGYALAFDGIDDAVIKSLGAATAWPAFTVSLWAKAPSLGLPQYKSPFSSHTPNSAGFQIDVDGTNPGNYRVNPAGLIFGAVTTDWVHLAVTATGTAAKLYYNGVSTAGGTLTDSMFNQICAGRNRNIDNRWPGSVDDLRVFNRQLKPEEITLVMRINPLRAREPIPVDGSLTDIRTATPLTWTKGDNASKHEVYFGTDAAAVAAANTSDTTGVYRSRVGATSFTPSEDLVWGREYFWRVDEINADGSVTAGKVWSFTVADYLIVDDFETYTDVPGSAIFDTWIDGVTNGQTGSTVGNFQAPFAERTIVYHGSQAMPLDYNNTKSPWYSQAERTFAPVENWTFGGVDTLVVHVRGQPVDFLESAGTITLSAAGADIWGTADECRYAFLRLTGDGSIIVRVDSVTNTNVWAKAGVMIRETLDPGSRHAMVVVTPGSGVAFQRRLTTNGTSIGTTQAGIVAPRWVKLTRTGNVLTAQHSADGVTWTDVTATGAATSDTVVMGGTIYIGLALTSHASNVACTAVFSNIKTTGNVTGSWQQAQIGVRHPGNSPQSFYVGIEDSAGKVAFVTHPDPAATTITTWTEWSISLSSFPGVNSAKVKKMYLGVGDRKNPVPDGAGRIYLDDLRITKDATAQPNPAPQ
jgi:hypothetical protein